MVDYNLVTNTQYMTAFTKIIFGPKSLLGFAIFALVQWSVTTATQVHNVILVTGLVTII